MRAFALPLLPLGVGLFGGLLWWPSPPDPIDLLLGIVFIALAVALQRVEVPLFGQRFNGESAAILLALLVVGPGVAAITALVNAVVLQLRIRSPVIRVLFAPIPALAGIAGFSAVYALVLLPDFGLRVPSRVLEGNWALGARYALAVGLGALVFTVIHRALVMAYRRREGGAGREGLRRLLEDSAGVLALLPVLLALTLAGAAFGALIVLFLLPGAGILWGAVVLLRRASGERLSVAQRLSAFFTVAVGTVFLFLSVVVLGTFTVRYTEAVVSGQTALGQSAVLSIREVIRRGESLRLSPVPRATLKHLLEQGSDLGYVALVELRDGERRPVSLLLRDDAEPFREQVERSLEAPPTARQHWRQGGRSLRVEDAAIPVLGFDRLPVAELRMGVDLGAVSARIREMGLLLGGASLLVFAVLLLLLRRYADRGLVEPLRRVGSALEKIAEGADSAVRLPEGGDREIAEVGVHFNRFADRLDGIIRDTRAVADENARLFRQQKEASERLHVQTAELERAYGELQRSQDQLLVSEKMAALGRLTAGIAHEINSPLGGILNSLELARTYADEYRSSATDPEITAEDHLAIAADLLSALQNATAATAKVAQFVRTIKGQTRVAPEEVGQSFDPALEIEATLALLGHDLGERGVRVEVEVEEGHTMRGDRQKFSLVVQNLVSNAVDAYDDRPGTVWVRGRAEGGDYLLEVEDRGSGIPEEIRPRIYDYLFTTKDVGRGTGLGLSLVHSIVTSMGGEISLETETGRGTTFRVLLPEPSPEAPLVA